jgi:hypothetical protein
MLVCEPTVQPLGFTARLTTPRTTIQKNKSRQNSSEVRLEKLTVVWRLKNLPALYVTKEFRTVFTTAFTQTRSSPTLIPYFP